jgi:hypothetical protein
MHSGGASLVGELHEVVGWEAVFVCQHMVVRGAAGALQPGVRVEVEGVLEGMLQVHRVVSFDMYQNLRLWHWHLLLI